MSLPLGEDIAKINPNEAMQITAEMETEALLNLSSSLPAAIRTPRESTE